MATKVQSAVPKLDLRKQYREFYNPPAKQVVLVEVPPLQYAMIDGAIEPGRAPDTSPAFQEAMAALYGIAYTLKFMSKQHPRNPIDYTVMGLEALWCAQGEEFDVAHPDTWRWTAMILQPDHIDATMFAEALAQLRRKKPGPALDRLRLETLHEGLCVQIMHIGPYADEPATVAKMHAFARENGYRLCGMHHEIYLGDPRRADPARLKTVLRQPVEKISG